MARAFLLILDSFGIGGAPDAARRIVGAGDMAGAPAVRRGMVGAGGRGAPPAVGVGGAVGTGGLTGGAMGTVADGTAGGASAAFKVIRTVSFFRGTLDVCLDGAGGWFSLSLMRSEGFASLGVTKTTCRAPVKPPAHDFRNISRRPKSASGRNF